VYAVALYLLQYHINTPAALYRKELLTMHNWTALVAEKAAHPVTMEHAQRSILADQYNLHLMDLGKIKDKAKWSWD
jgi:hypothetical protein